MNRAKLWMMRCLRVRVVVALVDTVDLQHTAVAGGNGGGGGCHTYTHKQHNSKPPHTNRMNDNDSNEGKSTGVYARVF